MKTELTIATVDIPLLEFARDAYSKTIRTCTLGPMERPLTLTMW